MNLGLLNSNIQNEYPQYRKYPNTLPPSMYAGDVGFQKSPFAQDVGKITRFFKNQVFNPAYDYTTKNIINPAIDKTAEYFGYGTVSPNVVDPSQESNITGGDIFQNISNFTTNTAKALSDVVVPTLNKNEDAEVAKMNANANSYNFPNYNNQGGLLNNEQLKDQSSAGLLNTNKPPTPATGFTYDMFTNNNTVASNNTQNTNANQNTNTNQNTQNNNQSVVSSNQSTNTNNQQASSSTSSVNAPSSNNPQEEGVLTDSKTEVTPTSLFMKKLENFATSEFGRDFFAEWAKASGPKVGEPSSINQNIGTAYANARKNQLDREKTKLANEPVFRGQLQTSDGNNYSLFSSGGQTYVNTPKGRVYEKDFQKVFGNDFSYRTMGQQTFGILNGESFQTLAKEIDQAETSMIKYADYLQKVGDTNVGIERLADGVSSMFKIALGGELDQDELNLLASKGELQGLLGASRQQVVGGGVLTEQDALRVLAYLGGDVTAFQSPQRVRQAISQLLRDTYKSYSTQVDFYNANVNSEYKSMGFKTKSKNPLTDKQLSFFDPLITSQMGQFNASAYTTDDLLIFMENKDIDDSTFNSIVQELELRK